MIQPRVQDTTTAAHERVYRALRTRIMHGEIVPGEALTLRGIGKYYEVSMTPAREAVRRLVAEGALFCLPLVGFRPRSCRTNGLKSWRRYGFAGM